MTASHRRRLRLWSLAFLGSLLIFSDTNFSSDWLLNVPEETDNPQYWYRAALMGHQESLAKLTAYATLERSVFWLSRAAELGDNDAYYHLALSSSDDKKQKIYLLKAANAAHVKSQFWLGLNAKRDDERVHWLTEAAEQQYLPAQIALYQLWILRDNFEKAMPWLESTAESEAESNLILGRYHWNVDAYKKAKTYFKKAQELGNNEASKLIHTIDRYWWGGNKSSNTQAFLREPIKQCHMQIQPVVNNLDGMSKALGIKTQFENDGRLDVLSICINEPIWVKPQQMPCNANWRGQGRLGCDLSYLATQLKATNFTHMLVLGKQGKANVNNGVLYLDLVDTYDVFVHELAHFVGFADEYPIARGLAERICHLNRPPPNIVLRAPVVKSEITDHEQAYSKDEQALRIELNEPEPLDMSYWEKFGKPIQLTRSRTCNNHENQAFKASSRLTFMEYYDTKYIPPLYLDMWQDLLSNRESLIPAYINLGQALERKGDSKAAQYWWDQLTLFQSASESEAVERYTTLPSS
jgi:hypothetical protein